MMEVVEEKVAEKGKQLATGISSSPLTPMAQKDAASDANNYNPYPPPVAKYEEVIADRELFIKSLEKLHATLGTKFMVPTIGGKELDLHRLFVEVTSRGGIEKRRWKEITAVFSFPSTATNASFVLRKYYMSLMHHYEQIYFFGAKGWNPVPAAAMQMPANYPVVGVIDGKFEHGYLVTVMVGTEKLKGVLYHTAGYPAVAAAHLHQNLALGNNAAMASGGRRRRRRKKLSTLDPTHPKPNRSGYNFFFAEQHARLKPLYPGKDREISKIIGDLWSKLTEPEKSGVKDKERYKSEMVIYRERQKTGGQVICNAVPIRQQPGALLEAKKLALAPQPEAKEETPATTPENDGGSSTGTDAERKLGQESESEENSTEVDARTESANRESFTDSDGFELRRRDNPAAENAEEVSGPAGEGSAATGAVGI
ncbi:unnamed protein product [Spirodela intermedia]|uniref:Uncharacterized protein n=1 Tax=Spirodela intermedia TaxID=51605 RepID=A0A7I8IPJ2_SPIIN|nr:unnamed protein product [Spirodela intermedia]CAA6659799.1 unnamed protein product [Spirodela intermedia]